MELIKDYYCTIAYHLEKANVVTDAFSRKSSNGESKGGVLALFKESKGCKANLNAGSVGNLIEQFQVKPTLEGEIVKSQPENLVL